MLLFIHTVWHFITIIREALVLNLIRNYNFSETTVGYTASSLVKALLAVPEGWLLLDIG